METTCLYPQVIGELLRLLDCTLDLAGCQQAIRIIRSREIDHLRIGGDGLYAACWDNDKINEQITRPVLSQYPQLQPLLQRFRDEGADFSSMCGWLNDFVTDIAWLSGNRPLPTMDGTFLKNIDNRTCTGRFGIVMFGEDQYVVESRDTEDSWTYASVFEMALDGWKVD